MLRGGCLAKSPRVDLSSIGFRAGMCERNVHLKGWMWVEDDCRRAIVGLACCVVVAARLVHDLRNSS